MLFACALSWGSRERPWFGVPFFIARESSVVNIEQLRRAVAQKEAIVKRLQWELEREDRELVELEKQLEKLEEQAQ